MAATRTFGKRAPDGAWEVPILGDIGFFGVNGEDLIRELNAVKPTEVKFIIYSGGGAVYDAIAAAGFIREQGITCYAEIYGVCASAATVFAALAGPKNTAIAPGSTFLVHMPFGGDQKLIDNATEFLLDLYVKSYGWSKADAKKHMEADEGRGIFWTAAEAKKNGVCNEIMDVSAVAARFNINTPAMAENNKKLKVNATVKLTTMEAVRSALRSEGTTAEVEVDIEQATADAMKEQADRIAELEAELAQAKSALEAAGQGADASVQEAVEAKEAAIAEANAAKEEVTAKAAEITALQASITELEAKLPGAKRTVANNTNPKIAGTPNADENPNVLALKSALAGTSGLHAKKQ